MPGKPREQLERRTHPPLVIEPPVRAVLEVPSAGAVGICRDAARKRRSERRWLRTTFVAIP